MFNEFEKEDDQWRPDEPKAWTVTKKVISLAFGIFVFAFIGFLLVRMFLSNPPKAMKKPVWDDTLLAAYNEARDGGEELKIVQIPTSNAFSEDSKFSVYTVTYAPSVKQLQFTVRYNDRVLNYLVQDYPEAKKLIDGGKEEIYVYSLTVTRGDAVETVNTYKYTKFSRGGYTYRRLIFDNIDLEGVSSVYVGAAYSGKPAVIRHTVCVYENSTYKLVSQMPLFSYSKPKGKTKNIFTRDI